MKLIVATTTPKLAEMIKSKGYDVVCETTSFSELQRIFGSSEAIGDTLLITENIQADGSVINGILKIHADFPDVRIIYMASGMLEDPYTVNRMNYLATHGIYDLFCGTSFDIGVVIGLLEHPKTKADCENIFIAFAKNKIPEAKAEEIVQTQSEIVLDRTKVDNVVAVTSVKPGTGKSYVSSNLAVTLAKYGKIINEEKKPRILLLEGDLQTLSVSTIFGIKDDEFNLKNVLFKIQNFLEENNYDEKRWYNGAYDIKQFIKRCCLRTNVDNLYILEGHDFTIEDLCSVSSEAFFYLIRYVATQFDEVVIDSNSSMQHPTTDPILQCSKNLFFVYTTDFNNRNLNLRYTEELKSIGVSDKIKYVLNKALVGDQKQNYSFKYTDEEVVGGKIKTDFEIPLVDMAVILNSTYKHVQLCLDNTFKTIPTRIAFLQLANSVMPLRTPVDLENQIAELEKQYKKKK